MPKKSLSEQAAAHVAKTHKLEEPLIVDQAEALDPKSKKPIYLFRVVGAEKGNEPAHAVILDDSGKPLEATDALVSLFDRTVLSTGPWWAWAIQTSSLRLNRCPRSSNLAP